jgi:hypothetical protein
MGQKELNTIIRRMKRAKKDILWSLDVLEETNAHLEGYDLTQDEIDQIFQTFYEDWAEIWIKLEPVLLKRSHVLIEGQIAEITGPLPERLRREDISEGQSIQAVRAEDLLNLGIPVIPPWWSGPRHR